MRGPVVAFSAAYLLWHCTLSLGPSGLILEASFIFRFVA